jgi:hypothetical protein
VASSDALHERAPTVAGIAQTLTVVSSANMSIYITSRSMLTWRKMTVAVCLLVALRTIDLRCADMTEEPARKNGVTLPRSLQVRSRCGTRTSKDRQAGSAHTAHTLIISISINLSRPDNDGK